RVGASRVVADGVTRVAARFVPRIGRRAGTVVVTERCTHVVVVAVLVAVRHVSSSKSRDSERGAGHVPACETSGASVKRTPALADAFFVAGYGATLRASARSYGVRPPARRCAARAARCWMSITRVDGC